MESMGEHVVHGEYWANGENHGVHGPLSMGEKRVGVNGVHGREWDPRATGGAIAGRIPVSDRVTSFVNRVAPPTSRAG